MPQMILKDCMCRDHNFVSVCAVVPEQVRGTWPLEFTVLLNI